MSSQNAKSYIKIFKNFRFSLRHIQQINQVRVLIQLRQNNFHDIVNTQNYILFEKDCSEK